jgi:hypothetical protein
MIWMIVMTAGVRFARADKVCFLTYIITLLYVSTGTT